MLYGKNYEAYLHLAAFFLLIFYLHNYKITYEILIIMYSKRNSLKNYFYLFYFKIFEYPGFFFYAECTKRS